MRLLGWVSFFHFITGDRTQERHPCIKQNLNHRHLDNFWAPDTSQKVIMHRKSFTHISSFRIGWATIIIYFLTSTISRNRYLYTRHNFPTTVENTTKDLQKTKTKVNMQLTGLLITFLRHLDHITAPSIGSTIPQMKNFKCQI